MVAPATPLGASTSRRDGASAGNAGAGEQGMRYARR